MSRLVSSVTLLVHEDGTRTCTCSTCCSDMDQGQRQTELRRSVFLARGSRFSRACAQFALSFYELFILCSIIRPLPWFGFPINSGSAASHSAWCVRFMSGASAAVPSNALGVDQPSACADQ